jgi:hypothetical protein
MQPVHSCLGFAVDCQNVWKGAGVVLMGFILFVGSIYLLLTAIFGRYMAYLLTVVAFSGWMIIQSSLWLFGYYSQGPVTPTNLGPKGAVPTWVVLQASPGALSQKYSTYASYPAAPWAEPVVTTTKQASNVTTVDDVQTVDSAVQTFLALQLNTQLNLNIDDPFAYSTTSFTVDDVRFAKDDKTPLAVAQAHFNGGGPLWTVSLYYDSGSVPRYSYMFLAGSILIFALHLPLLDRAEKRRKEFLTGGGAPAWYGPA